MYIKLSQQWNISDFANLSNDSFWIVRAQCSAEFLVIHCFYTFVGAPQFCYLLRLFQLKLPIFFCDPSYYRAASFVCEKFK